jgi:hypothetical protein
MGNEIKRAVKQNISVTMPSMRMPEPKVTVNMPEIKVPELKMPDVTIPEIKLPTINIPEIKVPTPKVTVNVPDIVMPEMKMEKMPRIVEEYPEYENDRLVTYTEIYDDGSKTVAKFLVTGKVKYEYK